MDGEDALTIIKTRKKFNRLPVSGKARFTEDFEKSLCSWASPHDAIALGKRRALSVLVRAAEGRAGWILGLKR